MPLRSPCTHPLTPMRSPADSFQTSNSFVGLLAWGIFWPPDCLTRSQGEQECRGWMFKRNPQTVRDGNWWTIPQLPRPSDRIFRNTLFPLQSLLWDQAPSPTEVPSSLTHPWLVSCPPPLENFLDSSLKPAYIKILSSGSTFGKIQSKKGTTFSISRC